MTEKTLFARNYLSEAIRGRERVVADEIDSISEDDILGSPVDDWCDYYEGKFRIDPVRIVDGIEVDHNETRIDVSHDPYRIIRDRSRPFNVKGVSVKYHVPFEGDEALLDFQPSTFKVRHPTVEIRDNLLIFEYKQVDANAEQMKQEFERELEVLKENLQAIEREIDPFNKSLREQVKRRVEARREKILGNRAMVESLGYPIRQRANAPKTYAAPQVKRRLTPVRPKTSGEKFRPEPELDAAEYEHILSVMQNMVEVMERSPKAFSGMSEEDLRHHFLVQLNGQYEGQASGETFNYEGKTDILIRVDGRNIFIGECKIWEGPKKLLDAIDQILGYLAWRDTKACICVFSRNKDTSAVLEKIPEIIKKHANFKRQSAYSGESGFRFVLHQKDDKNRDVILTVLVFDVPA